MKYITRLHQILSATLCMLMVLGSANCTSTITKIKQPVFISSLNAVGEELYRMVPAEHFNIDGKDVITNGKSESVLELNITNGKNIPKDDAGMKTLGKAIATLVKKSLKDPNEYQSYTIIFSTKTTDGVTTKTHWKAKYFDSKEL